MSEYSCYYYDSEHNRCHCFDNDAEMLADELSKRMYELEQHISDVNDANLYGLSQLEERIDALERRIEVLERKLNHKGVEADG